MQDNGDSPCLVCSETIPGEPGTLGKDNDLVGSMETPELQTLNQIRLSNMESDAECTSIHSVIENQELSVESQTEVIKENTETTKNFCSDSQVVEKLNQIPDSQMEVSTEDGSGQDTNTVLLVTQDQQPGTFHILETRSIPVAQFEFTEEENNAVVHQTSDIEGTHEIQEIQLDETSTSDKSLDSIVVSKGSVKSADIDMAWR